MKNFNFFLLFISIFFTSCTSDLYDKQENDDLQQVLQEYYAAGFEPAAEIPKDAIIFETLAEARAFLEDFKNSTKLENLMIPRVKTRFEWGGGSGGGSSSSTKYEYEATVTKKNGTKTHNVDFTYDAKNGDHTIQSSTLKYTITGTYVGTIEKQEVSGLSKDSDTESRFKTEFTLVRTVIIKDNPVVNRTREDYEWTITMNGASYKKETRELN